MNRRQLVAMWIGIGIAVSMCICPPWISTFQAKGYGQMSRADGYHLISYFRSGQLGYVLIDDDVRQFYVVGHGIDVVRLVVQEAAVVLLFGGLLISLKDRRKGS